MLLLPQAKVILSPSVKPSSVQLSFASASTICILHPAADELATVILFVAEPKSWLPKAIDETVKDTLLTFASVVSAIFPTCVSLPAT